MKLYISADIEGTGGIAHWDETDYDRGGRWYDYFRVAMSKEVNAACEGAMAAGVNDILVKDAHDSARNLLPDMLPRGVKIHRSWCGDPLCMMSGIEQGFDAVAMTGYHTASYNDGNPLSHTMATNIDELTINGERASEFTINAYIAAYYNVAVPFLSGDKQLCDYARSFLPGITAVAVCEGRGNGSLGLHPEDAQMAIREGIESALKKDLSCCMVKLPKSFTTDVRYKEHVTAYRRGFYPGAFRVDEKTIRFESDDWYEVLRFYHFAL